MKNHYDEDQSGDFAMPEEPAAADYQPGDKLLAVALRSFDDNRQIVVVFEDKEVTVAQLSSDIPADLARQLAKLTAGYFGFSDFLDF